MRKACLVSIVTLVSFATQANAQKDAWLVYGDGSYDNASYTPTSSLSNYQKPSDLMTWNANAGVGRMVSDHFMVGLQGGYGNKQVLPDYSSVQTWQAGVFGRYTTPISKRFYVYGQAFVGKYGANYKYDRNYSGKSPTPPYNSPVPPLLPDGNGFAASVFPAVGMNIINGYGIHMDIGGISYNSYTSNEVANQHHFNVTLGQQFSFGIHKVLGWKKLTAPKADAAPAVPATK